MPKYLSCQNQEPTHERGLGVLGVYQAAFANWQDSRVPQEGRLKMTELIRKPKQTWEPGLIYSIISTLGAPLVKSQISFIP